MFLNRVILPFPGKAVPPLQTLMGYAGRICSACYRSPNSPCSVKLEVYPAGPTFCHALAYTGAILTTYEQHVYLVERYKGANKNDI